MNGAGRDQREFIFPARFPLETVPSLNSVSTEKTCQKSGEVPEFFDPVSNIHGDRGEHRLLILKISIHRVIPRNH